MYYHGYGYYYPASCIFNCFYNCSDQCELLWCHNRFGYGDGYRWYGSLYLQLEHDSCSDRGYGFGPCCWYLYGDDYRRRWLYDDGYGYHHRTCCGAGSEHHSHYERKLFWRRDGFCYRDHDRRHRSLYV